MKFLTLTLMLIAGPATAQPGVLDVTVTGVRNAQGHILVAVCERATFTKESCALKGRAPAQAGSVVVRITGVQPGTYAAQAYHDENDNHRIDRNFLGIPEEGLGFSNDAPMRLGPPSFDTAAFALGPQGGAVRFALRYFN